MSTTNEPELTFDPELMARSYHAKLVLLGEAGTGKSSLLLRFTKDEFVVDQQATIGAAFMTQTLRVGSAIVKLEIWDTAGAERYRSLAPMYYRGAAAAIIVYDITNHDSFENAKSWVLELRKYASSNIIIALTGNKSDLTQRTVDFEEGQSYAEANQLIFNETSAKSGLNVNKVFLSIARTIPKRDDPNSQDALMDSVELAEEDPDKNKKRCC